MHYFLIKNESFFIYLIDSKFKHCLLHQVSSDTQMLLLLGTPGVLKRKWCLGEIATAYLAKVGVRIGVQHVSARSVSQVWRSHAYIAMCIL